MGAATPLHPAFKVQNRPAGPAQSPTTCSLGEASASLYILPCLPRFDSREMPKARPGASTSLCFESRDAGRNRGSDFCNFHLIAMPAMSSPRGDVLFLCSRKRKKPQREIKNYWFFSTGPQQLMMINDGDVSPMPSEDHSNFCKLH